MPTATSKKGAVKMPIKNPALYAIVPPPSRKPAAGPKIVPKKKPVVELRAAQQTKQRAEKNIKHVVERSHAILNRLEERAATYGKLIAVLQKRRACALARVERLEDDILTRMAAANVSFVDGWQVSFKAATCPVSVEIFDEESIPALYLRTKEVSTPNKAAIREALEADVLVLGARLVQRISLQRK